MGPCNTQSFAYGPCHRPASCYSVVEKLFFNAHKTRKLPHGRKFLANQEISEHWWLVNAVVQWVVQLVGITDFGDILVFFQCFTTVMFQLVRATLTLISA